jgi:hypothetical protein
MDTQILCLVSEWRFDKIIRPVFKCLTAADILKKRDLPRPYPRIMLQDVKGLIRIRDLKVTMIRPCPSIQNLNDINLPISEPETLRCLFTGIPGMADNTNFHDGPPIRTRKGAVMGW